MRFSNKDKGAIKNFFYFNSTSTRPVVLAVLILFSAGCMARRADLPWHASTFERAPLIVNSIDYDGSGRPLFRDVLETRPSNPGEHFTLVFSDNEQPVYSVDIAITRRDADAARPFRTLYTWTGKGFRIGAGISGHLFENYLRGQFDRSREDATGHLAYIGAVIVVPITVGTAAGFVIGLGDGTIDAVKELQRAVVNGQERITAVTRYEYDQGMLRGIRMFSPDLKTELVRTTFLYRSGEDDPYRTVVRSFAENRERVIEPADSFSRE